MPGIDSMFSTANLARFFYDAAERQPRREALVWEHGALSYAALRALAESLRHTMDAAPAIDAARDIPVASSGAAANFVGILAHRSPLAYAAVQAILAEGLAYVPLNPVFPAERNAYIVRKAEIRTLIVGEECAAAFDALLQVYASPLRVIILDEAPMVRAMARAKPEQIELVTAEAVSKDALDGPGKPLKPPRDGSAYVLFTSGSTGEPKGVRVRVDNVSSYVKSFLSVYPIFPDDRLSQTFDLTFDVSVHDQFVTWAAGATLVVFPESSLFSPLPYAASRNVTVWFSVPSLAAFLEGARQVVPGALPALRLSLFAGEKLTWKTCAIWKRIAPNSRLANLYGPTEATVAITHFEMPPDYPEERAYQGGIPIGKTFPGQTAEVRRGDGSPCANGEAGGLWVSGDQVAAGYLHEPQKTAERFVERDGVLWYRTGDLVLREPDGVLQYIGREDFQVKVMGYRIELGEIEHALMNCSGAPFALADVAPVRGEMDEIYCVLPQAFSDRKKEIKVSLKRRLPSYMVPRHLFFTDNIPLNANGKMDRGVLKKRVLQGALSG